jgi:hypothetical protein
MQGLPEKMLMSKISINLVVHSSLKALKLKLTGLSDDVTRKM